MNRKNYLNFTLACIAVVLLLATTAATAQEEPDKSFTIIKEYPHTPIKSQGWTGTCWSFCTISLIESDLIRLGKGEWELSEMFPVYHCYPKKAEYFLRSEGNNNFGEGGIDNDVLWVIRNHGIVRRSDYSGMWPAETFLNHSEQSRGMRAYLESLLKGRSISEKWQVGFKALLDSYMKAPPEEIEVDGKMMTPKEFALEYLEIRPEDYVGITSFLHMPYYQQCELWVPDNWYHHSDFYNVPLDEFIDIIRHSLENGFTVSIGADVSEDSYYRKRGYAVWKEEETITPEERERMWDAHTTTDDHGMHVVGLAKDESGKIFFYTKNSHGTDSGPFNGYVYLSENFIRAKINGITIHKDALSEEMRTKLGIE